MQDSFDETRVVLRVAVGVGADDSFESRRVDDWLDLGFTLTHEVVVELDPAGLLLGDNDIANLEEYTFDSGVFLVEGLSSVDCARALVSLQNYEQFSDQALALGHQILPVQVNAKVIATVEHFEAHNIGRLLLVEELSEHVGALCVCLAPLIGLCIEELQAEDALS